MKKIVRKRTFLLMLACLVIGFFVAYMLFVAPKGGNHPWVIAKTSDSSKKFITKETLVNEIKQKQKLITTEVSLSEKITIDNSWGSLAIFKKIQNINFVGTGTYSLDLSSLNSNNVSIQSNTISIKVPKPSVEMVKIDPNKTQFEPTENGLFRFGDIKLSTEDHETLTRDVEDRMKDKMLESKYYNTALENSEKTVTNLITTLNGTSTSYNVKVSFE